MATEKVKKVRKPRKKSGLKSTSKKKTSIKREIVSSAEVLFKNKIQLHELPTLEHIDDSELTDISVDTSTILAYDSQVEYLEFTGTQWTKIQPGVLPGDLVHVEIEFANTDKKQQRAFRQHTAWGGMSSQIYVNENGGFGYSYCYPPVQGNLPSYYHVGGTVEANTRYILELGGNDPKLRINGVQYNIVNDVTEIPKKAAYMIIGGNNDTTTLIGRIYRFWIERNEKKIVNIIPVRIDTTGYFYDKVSKRLLGNDGSSVFGYGKDVKDPIDSNDSSLLKIKSIGTALYRFSGIPESSDVSSLLDNSAAKRYHTKANELSAHDLKLFSDYSQQGTKNTYFNDHPYVVNDHNINALFYDQLLTRNNLEEAERYFVHRYLNSKTEICSFNWETDRDYIRGSNWKLRHDVNGLNELLDLDKWDSQATYKFEWGNDKRTTNIVDLNINSSYYYSVIGIVSVKTILPDQKSGTIYLEAKPRELEDIDDNWIVIDSAVFKFDQDNKKVGTYVALSGYMSHGYVTRLKLNLHPNAYSMNNWKYRENGSISNHYSNTFIGNAYILDDILSGDMIEMPIDIKFSDANYRPYKFHNDAITVDLTGDFEQYFSSTQIYNVQVSDVVQKIMSHSPEISALDISTTTQTARDKFYINGLRYSPTGKIYPLTGKMDLYSNCVLYPSYSSGTITVQQSSLHPIQLTADNIGEAWQNGRVLYNLDLSNLSALPDLDWPINTEIYGDHLLAGTITQRTTTTVDSDKPIVAVSDPVPLNNNSIVSYATYNPRVDNRIETLMIDFSRVMNNNVTGNITCWITATPNTYGGGGGNESWGRIRYGFTTAAQLGDMNPPTSTIVNPVLLKTKNITRWITDKMCTGARWNVHEGTLTTSFEQPATYKQIWIQACADTAHEDTKPTYFSVTANVKIKFKYNTTVRDTKESTEEANSQFTFTTTRTRENIVLEATPSKIYPTLSASQSSTQSTMPSVDNTFRVDCVTATANFSSPVLTVIPYPQNI